MRLDIINKFGELPDDCLVSEREVAALAGVACTTVATWRTKAIPNRPPFLKFGRMVRYRAGDLRDWLAEGARDGSPERPRKAALSVAEVMENFDRLSDDVLLSSKEVAAVCGLTLAVVDQWRTKPKPDRPRYLKIGTSVRYRVGDIRQWLADGAAKVRAISKK